MKHKVLILGTLGEFTELVQKAKKEAMRLLYVTAIRMVSRGNMQIRIIRSL